MSDDWERFAAGLFLELSQLPSGGRVIVYDRGRPERFVQFAQDPDRLLAEAAGDRVDEQSGLLTVRAERLLAAVGWQPPGAEAFDANWSYRLPWPARGDEYRRLVDAVVTALRDVYETPAPDALTYRAWRDGAPPEPLALPALGLKAEPSEPSKPSKPSEPSEPSKPGERS